jgi:CPA2 family monovalent cation:H+ antiporter-2
MQGAGMNLWYFLMELVMLLGGAFVLGALAQRLKQSPIIGYLLAGTIIGPLLFNADAVNQSAELGVSLLLFSIGLEFSFKRLRQMGRLAFGGGSVQVVGTMVCVCLLLMAFLPLAQALTIGAIVSLSSTAVVMRVLVDHSEIDSVRGRSCLAILLLQDMAIVPLVLIVSLLSPQASQTSMALHMGKVLASAVGLGVVLYLLLYIGVPRLLAGPGIFANRELTVLLAVSVGLGASWAAHALDISPALGAFVAGMLLGESPFATQIRADIGVARTIMVTLFFASVGMLAKPMWFLVNVHWVLGAAAAIVVLKTLVVFGAGRLFGLNNRHALATGISLAQVGEFSFVIAATARNGGVMTNENFDLAVSVIIILMFAAPYMVSRALPIADAVLRMVLGSNSTASLKKQSEHAEPASRILVVGLGPSGQEVVRHLKERQAEPIVIDTNPQSRRTAEELGAAIHLGDAASPDVLLHAGFNETCMAVVTVPDPATAIQIVKQMRSLRPQLPIAARCRYHRHMEALLQAGAAITVDEEVATGHSLAHQVVDFMHAESGEALACRLVGLTPGPLEPDSSAESEAS